MPLLRQGTRYQFNQVDGNHWHVTASKNGDTTLALVLQQGQFLRQCVDPVQSRDIQ